MRNPERRRGAVYVAVLATATLAAIMVVAGTAAAISIGRSRKAAAQADDARALARSALEMQIARASNLPAWRASLKDGTGLTSQTLGAAKVYFYASDAVDGDPSAGMDDPVTLTAEAVEGRARQKFSITLTPRTGVGQAMSKLVAAGGNITFINAFIDGDQTIFSNGTVTATSSYVTAPVEAGVAVAGTSYASTTTPLVSTISIPTFATASAYFEAIGTTVPYASISSARVRRAVVGATRGPAGGYTNAEGVYVIDCGGANFEFRECRIVGTIVLKNCPTCTLADAILWQPTHNGWPALLVDGALVIDNSTMTVLSESSAATNFNPAGNPYQGTADSDTTDSYPCELNGILYAKTSIKMTGIFDVNGWVITPGTLTIGATGGLPGLVGSPTGGIGSVLSANFSHVGTFKKGRIGVAPIGFRETPDFRAVEGTYARTVD